MKVLFLKHVINVWKEGEVKEVKPGYAMNMLFPKKLAIELTSKAEKEYKDRLKKEEKHKMDLIENRHKIVEELNNKRFSFFLKTLANNKVFWWIWEKDIIQKIKHSFKIDLTKKHIEMPNGHLKKLWEHIIYIKLWKDSMAKIFIDVNKES